MLDFDGCIKKLSTSKVKEMQNCDFEYLSLMISRLYPNRRLHWISRFVTSVTRVNLGNEILSNRKYRQGESRGCFVMARYLGSELDLREKTVRPGILNSIFEIEAVFDNNLVTKMMIVELDWLRSHTKYNHFGVNSSMKVWDTETEEFSESSFLPLKFVYYRCLFVKEKVKFNDNTTDTVNIVIPLLPKSL